MKDKNDVQLLVDSMLSVATSEWLESDSRFSDYRVNERRTRMDTLKEVSTALKLFYEQESK